MQDTRHITIGNILSLKPVYRALAVFCLSYLTSVNNPSYADDNGQTNLDLEIPALVRITNISDMDFGSYDGSGPAQLDDNVCVYNNSGSDYKITASGSGAGSAFQITDGNSHFIPYSVKFNGSATPGGSTLTANVSSSFSGANSTSQTCSGGTNANFQVTIAQNDLLSTPAGTYTGVLTLLLQPN